MGLLFGCLKASLLDHYWLSWSYPLPPLINLFHRTFPYHIPSHFCFYTISLRLHRSTTPSTLHGHPSFSISIDHLRRTAIRCCTQATMAPEEPAISPTSVTPHVGPHASYVQVATPYIFQDKIDEFFEPPRFNQVKEDTFRLQGVTWIDNVRKSLQL